MLLWATLMLIALALLATSSLCANQFDLVSRTDTGTSWVKKEYGNFYCLVD